MIEQALGEDMHRNMVHPAFERWSGRQSFVPAPERQSTSAHCQHPMKTPCAVNLHNAVTVSQERLGKRIAQLSPLRMNDICAALRFPGV
jgi:hypothetical protein